MKRMLLVLSLLLLLIVPALADQAEEIAQAIHPGYGISQRMDADGAALLVLTQGQQHTLLVMQGNVVTVDNPQALLPGDVLPSWSFTSDAVAWSYQRGSEVIRYHAELRDGLWGPVSVSVTSGESVRTVYTDGIALRQSTVTGSLRSEATPLPAPWLADCITLPQFAADALPLSLDTLPIEAFQAAADLLADSMTVLCGVTCPNGLLMLCDKPNHVSRVLVACVWNEASRGYRVTRSTAIMPACTAVPTASGLALIIGGCTYDISLTGDGCWGMVAMHLTDGDVTLNAQHLAVTGLPLQHALWGSNPWSDITAMDWQSLPRTYAEASGSVSPVGWAMVSNPDTQDTLHLRQQPDSKAYSLGRYYNGVPMRVISSNKDWIQVDIGGVTGWMMKRYVAQDYAMQLTASGMLTKHVSAAEGSVVTLYSDTRGDSKAAELAPGEKVLLLGCSGEQWYHVLVPELWIYGYIRMNCVK